MSSCILLVVFDLMNSVQFVAVCTNMNFMTRWSLASLKYTLDDVVGTDTERCMVGPSGKENKV